MPTTLSPVQMHRTWLAAGHHGGGFVRALSHAWLLGDPDNRTRIEATFPEIVAKYGPGTGFYPTETEG